MDAKEKKSKPKSKEYPACTLEKSIEFVAKFKDYPPEKPISYDVAAKECNVSATTKSFASTLSAARQFGLIVTSTGRSFTLLPAALRLVRPTESANALRALKIECFSSPKLYSELITSYSEKSIPSVSTLENIMVTYHGILPAAAKKAAETFIDTANEVGVVQNGILDLNVKPVEEQTAPVVSEVKNETTNTESISKETSPSEDLAHTGEFASPLNISFGNKRRAVLYMPIDATQDDAEYVKDMIALMFKKVYKVE